jgi:hypothetical protein
VCLWGGRAAATSFGSSLALSFGSEGGVVDGTMVEPPVSEAQAPQPPDIIAVPTISPPG